MRFVFIDALRGAASLSVALFHLLPYCGCEDLPLISWGWLGVPVFFVISGFVIPYTLRESEITWSFAANYALRRVIRLDPPYWACIVFTLLVNELLSRLLTQPSSELNWPGWPTLLAHLFYLQQWLDYKNISLGFWTLCIEVQFYLTMLVVGACFRRWPTTTVVVLGIWFATATLLFDRALEHDAPKYWDDYISVLPMFALFGLGISAYFAVVVNNYWPAALACTLALIKIGFSFDASQAAGVATTVAIVAVGRRSVGNVAWLQWLGKISYSLYLMHWPTGRVVVLAGRFFKWPPGITGAVAVCAAICVSWAVWYGVERPSVRLAATLKPKRTGEIKS